MISRSEVTGAFAALGEALGRAARGETGQNGSCPDLSVAVEECRLHNPWFIGRFVSLAFRSWAEALEESKVNSWLQRYDIDYDKPPADVLIVPAGNIPLVGLHDVLSVIASGNRALVRQSSGDSYLLPIVMRCLESAGPFLSGRVRFMEGTARGFEAVIATGSNNTSRYFEYYFGKYPHVIRKNRNSAAVITGGETKEELRAIASDICDYFGLGCRSVSRVFFPEGFGPDDMWEAFAPYRFLADHHKYRNNYDYQKSILMVNRIDHHDNGLVIFRPSESFISPVSVVHYSHYRDLDEVRTVISAAEGELQCVVSASDRIEGAVGPGRSQFPELWDYADGADTMAFLARLNSK